MKYAVVKVTNGNYFIEAERFINLDSAKVKFHQVCSALWNASDVNTACVMIVDENLDTITGYKETIRHNTVEVPTEEPTE